MSAAKIRVLPSHVIDHIAAGEVVERPASVAKELVENALDAGASTVHVSLRGGGLEHLAVIDNGCGMSPDEARLCLLRHATSKLTCSEDLFQIETLGFRGEALSSIASVSRMRLVTRPAGASAGYEISTEGGKIVREGAVGCPFGTQMMVDDLFFNTPARRKFMRAPATEQTHLVESIKRVFLGARRGGGWVSHQQRRLLDIPDGIAPPQRVQNILGRHVGALAGFDAQVGEVRASGFVGVGQGERSDGRNLWLFVNGRFVRDRYLSRAVIEAVAHRSWDAPAVVVAYLDLPAARVDVNVHPQKLEVRFADGRDVFAALTAGVCQGVQALGNAPLTKVTGSAKGIHVAFPRRDLEAPSPKAHELEGVSASSASFAPAAGDRSMPWPLGAGYFMCAAQSETFIVHWPTLARHQALCQWQEEARTGQPRQHTLLLPEAFDGRAPWQDWLAEEHAALQAYGFDIAPVGPGRFLIRAIPEALACGSPRETALQFVEAAYRHRRDLQTSNKDTIATLIAPCVAALEVSGANDVVAAYLADAQWTHMRSEQGVVRVTPPLLQTLFGA